MCVAGTLISGISVGFFKRTMFGVDPFQSFMAGLDTLIPIHFGTLYVIANVLLLLFALILDRNYIGISTLINLFFPGYVVQFSQNILQRLLPEPGIPARILCLAVGLAVMCISASPYFTADLGGHLRCVGLDSDQQISHRTIPLYTHPDGRHLHMLRYFALLSVRCETLRARGGGRHRNHRHRFFMGPLIDFFNLRIARPLLYGKFRA